MRVRIGVDGYNLAMPHGTGVATYGFELAETLAAMGHRVDGVFGLQVPEEPSLREVAFFDSFQRPVEHRTKVRGLARRIRWMRSFGPTRTRDVPLTQRVEKAVFRGRLPEFSRLVSSDLLFERAFRRFRWSGRFVELRMDDPPDVMHWTYPIPVRLHGARNVYTLHDLVPLKLPYTTLDDKLIYGRLVAQCVEQAAQLCTVSESSKRDILDRYAIDPDRITNTYQAVRVADTITSEAEDAHAIDGIFGLEHRSYFLYFGAIEPKKNIGRLIEAYLSLQSNAPLVIVGARAWESDQELKLIPGGGAKGEAGTFLGQRGQKIIRLDYLPRSLLARLVRGARAVVFPSLYEGFGLPVLEALQLGTPVIASGTASLPEVAGDAAMIVDPYSVASIHAAMAHLDADEPARRDLAARGLRQAALFTRERYQSRLTELYDRATRRVP